MLKNLGKTSNILAFSLVGVFVFASPAQAMKRSFRDTTAAQNKQRVHAAALASGDVYDVYKAFKRKKWNFVPGKQLSGYWLVTDSITQRFGSDVYKLHGVFCAKKILGGAECGLFVAFYEDLFGKALPIIAVKGVSSAKDWKNSLLNQGAFFISWIFDYFQRAKSSDSPEARANIENGISYLNEFVGDHFILTGHSLGGGLAQMLAYAITANEYIEKIPLIDLVVFNSLAGESILARVQPDTSQWQYSPGQNRFSNKNPKTDFLLDAGKLPENVLALSISTQEDFVLGYNDSRGTRNFGVQLRIPTERQLDGRGFLSNAVDRAYTHGADILADDLEFTWDYARSARVIEAQARYYESPQAMWDSESRARQALRDFSLDENDPVDMSSSLLSESLGIEEKKSRYRRMHEFMSNSEVLHIIGVSK